MRTLLLAAALAGTATVAGAQATAQDSAAQRVRDKAMAILGIPKRAEEIRQAGVPDKDVQSILDILKQKQLPPEEVEEILIVERDAVREHGPTDNFGAFVQSQLDRGLRGRELAAAIRAEHAARGKGKGKMKDGPPGQAGRGRPDEAEARGKEPGDPTRAKRPDDAGAARDKRPEGAAADKKGGPPAAKGQGNKRPTG